MKGKYAGSAERRREMDALTREAATAARERDALRVKLDEANARHAQAAADFRAKTAALERQRDEATSPALVAAQNAVSELKAEITSLRKRNARGGKTNLRLVRVIVSAAIDAGFDEKAASGGAYGLWDREDVLPATRHGRRASYTPSGTTAQRDGMDPSLGNVLDRVEGFSELSDALAIFYDVLATGVWRQDGDAFVVDDWFTRTPGASRRLDVDTRPQ
jgi:hypothetical protein